MYLELFGDAVVVFADISAGSAAAVVVAAVVAVVVCGSMVLEVQLTYTCSFVFDLSKTIYCLLLMISVGRKVAPIPIVMADKI